MDLSLNRLWELVMEAWHFSVHGGAKSQTQLSYWTELRFIIAFLPKSKCLILSWLQSPSTVILEPGKIKFVTASTFSSSICHEVMGLDTMIWGFLMLSVKPAFSLSSFIAIKRLFVPLHFLPLELYHLHIWRCWYFSLQSWFQLVVLPVWHFIWCTLHRS